MEVAVTVPGKVMLGGEYAVLSGGSALAFTVNKHLRVKARLQNDFEVSSSLWRDKVYFAHDKLPRHHEEPLIDSVCGGAARFNLKGLQLAVDSDLTVEHGIGSSSAVRLGVMLALGTLSRNDGINPWDMAREAWQQQKRQQQNASGYDIATQLTGGVVKMAPGDPWPGKVERLPQTEAGLNQLVQVFVGGSGAATGRVTGDTYAWLVEEKLTADLLQISEALSHAFCAALSSPDNKAAVRELYQVVKRHRQLFRTSPYFPLRIAIQLEALPGLDHGWTYKTTGAGGEDAILLIGPQHETRRAQEALRRLGWYNLNSNLARQGASVLVSEMTHDF